MLKLYLSSALVIGLTLLACVIAFPGRRAVPLRRWRLALPALLVTAAMILFLRLPPFNDLRDPEVWMIGLPFAVVGIVRGAMIGLQVDHGQGKLLLDRAPEGFWIPVAAVLLILVDIVIDPIGRPGSQFARTAELGLMILACFLVGRDATILVRSRDIPQHDL